MLFSISAILLITSIYFYQAVKTITKNRIIWWGYWLFYAVLIGLLLYYMYGMTTSQSTAKTIKITYWLTGIMLLLILPKLIAIPILIFEDLTRIVAMAINRVRRTQAKPELAYYSKGRRKFISQLAIGIASIPFAGMVWGIGKGRYDYKVHKVTIRFKDLPKAFHGFTITQLSDIHAGSFGSVKEVERGIALANAQKSDLMVFTGDLVNNFASEMEGWTSVFSKLEAPFGKYSIMGNHDYGDYSRWDSEEAKADNLKQIKEAHQEIGFRLLLDENLKIEKNGEHFSLIGVENWSEKLIHRHGNLNQALKNVNPDDFKIVLSHDPTHWDAEIRKHSQHVHLTLSGHTHGMQMGVEIPGYIKWSPAQYLYEQWAGLYKKNDQYIYVNRGFGYISYPGRVGILPEITVITLEKA